MISLSLVAASRGFRVIAPLYLKEATNKLIATPTVPSTEIIIYCGKNSLYSICGMSNKIMTNAIVIFIAFVFLSDFTKQLQTFLYLRVKQSAYKDVSAKVSFVLPWRSSAFAYFFCSLFFSY